MSVEPTQPAAYEPVHAIDRSIDALDEEMEQSFRDLDLKIALLKRDTIELGVDAAKDRRPKT